mgnify:FL=1
MNENDINALDAEAGIIASLIHNIDLITYSDRLLPLHFTQKDNRCIYTALQKLYEKNIKRVDAYNIIETLNSEPATRKYADELTIDQLQELIEISDEIARHSENDYKVLVSNVIDAALRRDLYKKLSYCQRLCLDRGEEELAKKVYSELDDVLTGYSSIGDDIKEYRDVVDDCWGEIQARQGGDYQGYPFPFRELNNYVTIEPGELVIFGGGAKEGKSMLMLNIAMNLLEQGKSVLYLDSELSDRLFTQRLLSNRTGITFRNLGIGNYTAEDGQKISNAMDWIKNRKFAHIYIPMFDISTIFTTIKRFDNLFDGLDVVIVDYFKSTSDAGAFETYSELGKFVDFIKNSVCGDMGIAGIGAAQTTATGKLADSAKIARNASTIVMMHAKTPDEIEADGEECGNRRLNVCFNRNGAQQSAGEYIDLGFDGDRAKFYEVRQHIPQDPF